MIVFLKLLRFGLVGLSILFGLSLIFLAVNVGPTFWPFIRNPEIKATLTYSIGEGPEKIISLTDGQGFPEEDLEKLIEEGKIKGRIQVLSGDESPLMALELKASAPIDEVKEALFNAFLETAGRELVKQALGEEAKRTIGELIESPPEELVNFFGESYRDVLTDLAEGDLSATLEEVISENPEEKVEKLPKETLNRAVDELLGKEADKTLGELLESVPEEIKDVLGEDYEEKIMEIFGEDKERTLREVIVNEPGRVLKAAKEAFKGVALEKLFERE